MKTIDWVSEQLQDPKFAKVFYKEKAKIEKEQEKLKSKLCQCCCHEPPSTGFLKDTDPLPRIRPPGPCPCLKRMDELVIYTLLDNFDGTPMCRYVTSLETDFKNYVFEDVNGLHKITAHSFDFRAFKDHEEAFTWLLSSED
jgi:hypothetical protein